MPEVPLYSVQEIDETWNPQMMRIVQASPIEANGFKIIFDHSPDLFFLPRLRCNRLRCGGFFIRKQLHGFAMMLYKQVFVHGQPQTVLYFCNLVASPEGRHKGMLYRMSDFFLEDLPEDIRMGHAVIMRGNVAARRLLNRFHPRYPNMPYSRIIGAWHVKNILLLPKLPGRQKIFVRPARNDDLDTIVELLQQEYQHRLFGPVITKESIQNLFRTLPNFNIANFFVAEIGNEIAGVCCAWDMAPVKRNRVMRYGPRFKLLKQLVDFLAPVIRYPKLPDEGKAFKDVTILEYAVKDRDPKILKALLDAIYCVYRKRGYHLMIFGHPANDPLAEAAKPFFYQEVISDILIFSKSRQFVEEFHVDSLPYIDMMLL